LRRKRSPIWLSVLAAWVTGVSDATDPLAWESTEKRSQLLLSEQGRAALKRVSGPIWDVYGEEDPAFLNGAL
jgi:hypothetical protein